MRSRFWSFVEACDETQSTRAVKDLLVSTSRELGVSTFAIVTHAVQADLRSLGVLIHNWPQHAIDYLFAGGPAAPLNPLFEALEATRGPVFWPPAQPRRDSMSKQQRAWFNRLRDLVGGGEGVSQAVRSTIVGASCSITASERLDLDRVKLCTRIGNYAYQQVLSFQRPRLTESERLTAREHEFLYRATIFGERPSDVANQLGVKISTVRTLRQKASIRLDAGSQEQAAWRMVETGQLFRSGRKGRPRAR
jgi:DNA-binding CsgD family transcriptional regulator